MTHRMGAIVVLLAALAGFAGVLAVAPGYVLAPSFPLDNAWAHATSARALATTGRFEAGSNALAAAPGSPLWAALMAVPHLVGGNLGEVVLGMKLVGLALHVLGALILFHVLNSGRSVSLERMLGPMLVAFHPDLISASLSGVEVPLATLTAIASLWAAQRASAHHYGALALIAPFVRPELAVLSLVLPPALYRHDRHRLWRLAAAGLAGSLVAFGLMAARVLPTSSIPHQSALPGTKGAEVASLLGREAIGFSSLLDQFPVVDSSLLMTVAIVAAAWFIVRAPATSGERIASAAMLGGISLCLVSFSSLPPVLPKAFYAQRYALPAIPLLVAAVPILVYEGLRRVLPLRAVAIVRLVVPLLLVSSELLDAPTRYLDLANDARNVDELQVAMAQALGRGPAWQVVWASDGGGALRYFAPGRIVDVSLLETRSIAPADARALLVAHRPNFIEIVPRLSSIDRAAPNPFPGLPFTTTTLYTVDGSAESGRQRWLVACTDPSRPARFAVNQRVFEFRCGEGDVGSLARGGD